MKIFNLDLHISVIEDIQKILQSQGHEVTSWNMSGHNWVFGRQRATTSVVNPDNWTQINQKMCDDFYNTYKDELSKYDAFLVTYPPVFSMLFEKWNKPIIIVAPIRYELPFSTRPEEWERFNEFIRKGCDSGQIILVANSKYDAEYGKYFTDREWTHIPNICDYTAAYYSPTHNSFLYYSRLHQYTHYLGGSSIPRVIEKYKALGGGYKWTDLVKYKGIIGIPYNISTMSIFEFYSQNMPMFFPTVDLMIRMKKDFTSYVLAETSWNQTWNIPSGSVIRPGENDPNDFANLDKFKKWLPLADFYDTEWMPHIQYFDDWNALRDRLNSISDDELREISSRMQSFNPIRKDRIKEKWQIILQRINK